MRLLVTGSSGHLGEALVRTLRTQGHSVVGLDVLASAFTDVVGSISDRPLVRRAIEGSDGVLHAATLHKPHVATHCRQAFVDTNVSGTLVLLEEAVSTGVRSFVFTSTTSTFGRALSSSPGEAAAWITEDVACLPKNIYGATKTAAEDLCELVHRDHGLACIVLRTSRFFPEEDDDPKQRAAFAPDNLKANEFMFRRVELNDVVVAHEFALRRAPELGFQKYIISATTPFARTDAAALGRDAASLIRARFPEVDLLYAARDWRLPERFDRVYDNTRARLELGWRPRFDFAEILRRLRDGSDVLGPLAAIVGAKGYHRM